MGYHTSNAAYAYDMRSEAQSAPIAPSRPSLDVVHGAGRQASQDVSPQFTHCVKVFAVLVTVFVVLGLFRVTVAGFTAASLNSAATLSNNLTTAQEESSDLEVMRSVYGSSTRAGRQASQDVSPQFTHCVKVFAVLVTVFVVLGLFRVTVAGFTAASLNSAATLSNNLTTAQEESSDLEVMRSVYGSSTRIRDLAEGYGMVAAEGGVTLDFTEHVDAAAQ